MKKLLFLPTVMLIAYATPSRGEVAFMSYAQWAASDQTARDAYIAGAFDSYAIIAIGVGSESQKSAAAHYSGCLRSARFTYHDLSERVRHYAEGHPSSQRASVIGALIDYLAALCGTPNSN